MRSRPRAAIEAADAATRRQMSSSSLVASRCRLDEIKIKGDVAGSALLVDAGAAAAGRVGILISVHVIPRPDDETEILVYLPVADKGKTPKWLRFSS